MAGVCESNVKECIFLLYYDNFQPWFKFSYLIKYKKGTKSLL